jgi:hypothetical protein
MPSMLRISVSRADQTEEFTVEGDVVLDPVLVELLKWWLAFVLEKPSLGLAEQLNSKAQEITASASQIESVAGKIDNTAKET